MRKIILTAILTLTLAGTASASNARNQNRETRERESPMVRFVRVVKYVFGVVPNGWPTIPIP